MDNTEVDERLNKDVADYIGSRVHAALSLPRGSGSWRRNKQSEAGTVEKLTKFLTIKARGCLLYVKLVLDLIERGTLNLKSSSFKSLPQSVSEVYHLALSLVFPSVAAYQTVGQILSCALAQLQPVTLATLYTIFCSLHVTAELSWPEFEEKYSLVRDFLVTREDGSLAFFHSTFREWLLGRREGESTKVRGLFLKMKAEYI